MRLFRQATVSVYRGEPTRPARRNLDPADHRAKGAQLVSPGQSPWAWQSKTICALKGQNQRLPDGQNSG